MKFWKLLLATLAMACLLAVPDLAQAGSVLCAPQTSGTGSGARTVGGTGSAVPSLTLYSLNSGGCAMIAQQDIGYFLSQGYSPGANSFSSTQVAITANQTTSTSFFTLPAGAIITNIVIRNTTANAVTGGVNIGTAAAGAQVVSAQAVAANALIAVPSASILLQVFGSTNVPVAQPLFVNAVTAFNSASLNVTIFYSLFSPE